MAALKNTGKMPVFDGTGTHTPALHTGHGAHPERARPHMRQMAIAHTGVLPSKDEKRKDRLAKQNAALDARNDPHAPWMPVGGRRDGKGRLLPDNWGSQELEKVASQPSHGMPDLGSFYSQAHTLARTRFIQPTDARTAQLPGMDVGTHGGASPAGNSGPGTRN